MMNQQNGEIIAAMILQVVGMYANALIMGLTCAAIWWLRETKDEAKEKLATALIKFNIAIGTLSLALLAFLEHVIHRAGHYLGESGWEVWRSRQPYDKYFVAASMGVAGISMLYSYFLTLRYARAKSNKLFWTGLLCFSVGAVLFVAARLTV